MSSVYFGSAKFAHDDRPYIFYQGQFAPEGGGSFRGGGGGGGN